MNSPDNVGKKVSALYLGVFRGETGWFAIAVFAVVLIIVAGLLWRAIGRARPIE